MFPTRHWLIPELKVKGALDNCASEFLNLCFRNPFTVPFRERVCAFRELIRVDREKNQPPISPGIQDKDSKKQGFEDTFAQLRKLKGEELKKNLYNFVNAAGEDEVGIDAGGLFKEMWTTLSEQAFDPNFGLFKTTSDELLYPNHANPGYSQQC